MPSERISDILHSQNTLTELSDIPIVNRLPVSLSATQLTWRQELSKLMEPIDGSYFSVRRTYWRISLYISSCSSVSISGIGMRGCIKLA